MGSTGGFLLFRCFGCVVRHPAMPAGSSYLVRQGSCPWLFVSCICSLVCPGPPCGPGVWGSTKKTAQKDVIKDITSDSQMNSYFPYR